MGRGQGEAEGTIESQCDRDGDMSTDWEIIGDVGGGKLGKEHPQVQLDIQESRSSGRDWQAMDIAGPIAGEQVLMCSTSGRVEFLRIRLGKRGSQESEGLMVTESGLQLTK